MTQTEFIKRLNKLVKSKKWTAQVNQYGEIRLRKPRGKSFSYCPITAVCLDDLKKDLDPKEEAMEAGRLLKLQTKTIEYLSEASDYRFTELHDEKLEKTRTILAECLNLDIRREIEND